MAQRRVLSWTRGTDGAVATSSSPCGELAHRRRARGTRTLRGAIPVATPGRRLRGEFTMSNTSGRRPSAALCAAVVTLALAGCTGKRSTPDATAAGSGAAAVSSTGRSTAETANVCVGTDAHDRHAAAGFGCAVCHACPGALSFGSVTFPGGASTANGTMSSAGGTTTCSVGCHSPLGAEPHEVAWNAGPLPCTACHTNVATLDAGSTRSSHALGGASTSATCESCHDQSQHTRGQVRLLNGDGTSTSGTCVGCHSGQGQTLGDHTPPLLVGWSDTVRGDFHGERTGTCRFDTLDTAGQRSDRCRRPAVPRRAAGGPERPPHHLALVVPERHVRPVGLDVRHRDDRREREPDRSTADRSGLSRGHGTERPLQQPAGAGLACYPTTHRDPRLRRNAARAVRPRSRARCPAPRATTSTRARTPSCWPRR